MSNLQYKWGSTRTQETVLKENMKVKKESIRNLHKIKNNGAFVTNECEKSMEGKFLKSAQHIQ